MLIDTLKIKWDINKTAEYIQNPMHWYILI